MVQQFRTLVALAEDPGTHMVHIQKCRQNIPIHKIKLTIFKK